MLVIFRKTPLININPSSFLSTTSRFLSIHSPNPNPNPNFYEPTSSSYDELIAVAGRSKDLTTLHRLLNKRYKDGLFNTSNTFKFITETKDLNLDAYLDDLLQTLSNLDKGFARKNAFDCLISHLCKANKIDASLRVIETMIEKEMGVNAVTFHPLISSLAKKRRFDEAWGVLDKMRGNGIPVDVTSLNYILSSYCFNGDLVEASKVLEKIRDQGLKQDTRTYDALVMGACRVGKVEAALVLLRRMEEERLPPLFSTHAHVIKSLIGLGCFGQAVEFVMGFAGRDKGLDTENLGFLVSCLVRKKIVEEAKLVYGEMEKRGLGMGDKLRKEYKKLLLISGSTC